MGINKIGFEQDKMTYGTYAAYKEQLGAAELVPVSHVKAFDLILRLFCIAEIRNKDCLIV